MSEGADLSVEATGETVGEAKWAALRELERRHPGLDKGAVRFQVVSEGERGLLGVGFAPAQVVATVPADAVPEPVAGGESGLAARAREVVERIADEIGVDCRVEVEEREEEVVVTCTGPDLGVLIGKHGQTIDAIQYLVNAIAYRAYADERKDVVVDAAGYRARRRATLESLALRTAERVRSAGEAEELEPMTAVERKIVHLRLKDVEGVETTSEGTEPNRYVVVLPEPG
ncbi:MAG TPA: RNA-binding cell elongation regulator Jag/EloR [Gaiellaceae bacterium]|jgi:spoIIIJ-associated protein|nr:RNA-binding cell elongation regulator Jag/EloR [Gaiellaceae bacterium]